MTCKTGVEYSCPKIDIVKAILKKKYLELEPIYYCEYLELCELLEEIREINTQLREKLRCIYLTIGKEGNCD